MLLLPVFAYGFRANNWARQMREVGVWFFMLSFAGVSNLALLSGLQIETFSPHPA